MEKKQQLADNLRRWREEKRKLGWRFFTTLVPPEMVPKLQQSRKRLMKAYNKSSSI
jgi:hypothetical protein